MSSLRIFLGNYSDVRLSFYGNKMEYHSTIKKNIFFAIRSQIQAAGIANTNPRLVQDLTQSEANTSNL